MTMTLEQEQKLKDQWVQVITKVKRRLKIKNNDADDILSEVVEQMGYKILLFCNISEIPASLLPVWASMCIDFLRRNHADNSDLFGDSAIQSGAAKSISEGDVSVSFGVAIRFSDAARMD